MRIALDTNRYVDLMLSTSEVVSIIESVVEVFVPFVVVAELRCGFLGGSRATANEQVLTKFMQRPLVRLLLADAETTVVYARLHADLRRRGRTIPHNDLWIAALCAQHGLALYTRDKHFDYVPQVARV